MNLDNLSLRDLRDMPTDLRDQLIKWVCDRSPLRWRPRPRPLQSHRWLTPECPVARSVGESAFRSSFTRGF